MRQYKLITFIVLSLCVFVSTPIAIAGPYSDDMARCLVEKTSDSEKNELVKWMFSAVSAHPALTSISSVTAKQREEINRATAEMFVKLLTETCKDESVKSIKFEGAQSISVGFKMLGQVAAQGMFGDPKVAQEVASLGNYADKEKLKTIGLK